MMAGTVIFLGMNAVTAWVFYNIGHVKGRLGLMKEINEFMEQNREKIEQIRRLLS